MCRTNENCKDAPTLEKATGKLKVSPWWGTSKNWPDKPKSVIFDRVHKFTDSAPWCTYILKHPVTVAPSDLGSEDLQKFPYHKVQNDTLFHGCHLATDDVGKMNNMKRDV